MSEKHISLKKEGYSDEAAARYLFPHILSKRVWFGVLIGVMGMAFLDFTDVHICVGECDASGYDLMDFNKGTRKQ